MKIIVMVVQPGNDSDGPHHIEMFDTHTQATEYKRKLWAKHGDLLINFYWYDEHAALSVDGRITNTEQHLDLQPDEEEVK